MSLLSLLIVGFIFGVRHALEPDHLAAVASLATGKLRDNVRQGAVWGLGHSLTLLLFGGAALLLGDLVPEYLPEALELVVGMMLVILGVDVLRRVISQRVHLHVHQHGAQGSHVHVHAHREAAGHEHEHWPTFPFRALFVGLMHGLAGSAALVLLALAKAPSATTGLLYILVFGVGSMIGMALLSFAISVPLRVSSRKFAVLRRGLRLAVGLATIVLGLSIVRVFTLSAFK